MRERLVALERAEERLLERVLGAVAAHPPHEEPEHPVAVLDVEALERRDRRHGFHHRLETRGRAANVRLPVDEGRRRRPRRVGRVRPGRARARARRDRPRLETWEEAAGGGAVAAVQLAKLNGRVRRFYTALGDDELGRAAHAELSAQGVHVEAEFVPRSPGAASRTSTRTGSARSRCSGTSSTPSDDHHLPWLELGRADAVYFTAATSARSRPPAGRGRSSRRRGSSRRCVGAGVELDALVGSGEDLGERYQPGDLDPPPRLVVSTAGPLGGWTQPGGPFRAAPLPGPVSDAYGAGDSLRRRADLRPRERARAGRRARPRLPLWARPR